MKKAIINSRGFIAGKFIDGLVILTQDGTILIGFSFARYLDFLFQILHCSEPISLYTLRGVLLVIAGLFIVQRFKKTMLIPQGELLSQQKITIKN